MEENSTLSRHGQLKHRFRNRIEKELFDCMPTDIQDYLLEADPAELNIITTTYINHHRLYERTHAWA